ncbi:FAS1-like dehydratase domain-containing protein [Sulfitobacter mediterraneus]|uniref:FAS1-like dehydratase domain-containing protein n=1 Tax=Sulfitobacter mediterraneus TaxID=83219 RepID=UPI0024914371|nr:MaoC family dehydratase N-terminal domain-containing protein [Sulfitobacter mediterraneus]
MTQLDLDALKPWLGRTETKEDVLTPGLIDKFRATLDPHLWDGAGDVPLGIHWCLTLDAVSGSSLSEDGHSKRGGFLPPVPLPARMWAGGDITHIAPLEIGQTVTRRSTIADITVKQGRSGTLVFVDVQHTFLRGTQVCIQENQTIVYRDITAPKSENLLAVAPDSTTLKSCLTPDPVLLFRFSALTFNAHRIHYDHTYATETEAYSGLVVHGPLQATLLLNLAARALTASPHRFKFRGIAPLTLPCEIQLNCLEDGDAGTVWCQDRFGRRSFSADYAAA